MRVHIVGGGLTGSDLARSLLQEGHQVTLIEQREELLSRLHRELPGATIVHGDGCEPNAMERSGIREADVVVAATGHDEDNLVVCTLAKQEFDVRRTVGRVNNPKNEWLFTRDMGVDVAVSQAHIIAGLMREEMASLEMLVLLRLHRGDTMVVEDILTPQSRAAGKAVSAIGLPDGANLVAIVRDEELIIPRSTTVLAPGDRVIAILEARVRDAFARALA